VYKLHPDEVEKQLLKQDFELEDILRIVLEVEDGEYKVIYDDKHNIYKVETNSGYNFEVK
jgi:hypothetical protein